MAAERDASPPRRLPDAEPEELYGQEVRLEEEAFAWYNPDKWYPVQIGHVYESRYQVLLKLGFGSASTARNEEVVLRHLERLESEHPGQKLLRSIKDSFELQGKIGPHVCLIFEPLGLSLADIRELAGGKLPENLLKGLEIPDDPGDPVISDFGDAQYGEGDFDGEVMPDLYRAPEIILGIPWDEKIDIWALGLMVWDLFEGKLLYNTRHRDRNASRAAHFARTVSLLGPPPDDLLDRGSSWKDFFDEEGKLIVDGEIPESSFEEEECNLEGAEQAEFLVFLRKMLQWKPEDRLSARELMEDPWLCRQTADD
ncbi:uncharacterized protein N0V96_003032 [Colletotrichum fioriniae]|uniref:uncharacterized protein n=1 Tax=Colletotrichum fioriniae TaxID=710243 RepID=UPI0032DACF56|nr:hypothetical protein N0V96_003032 [Colletotrichum fioriniae]